MLSLVILLAQINCAAPTNQVAQRVQDPASQKTIVVEQPKVNTQLSIPSEQTVMMVSDASPKNGKKAVGISRRRIALGMDKPDAITWTQSVLAGITYYQLSSDFAFPDAYGKSETIRLMTLATVLGGSSAYLLINRPETVNAGTISAINYGIFFGAMNGILANIALVPSSSRSNNRSHPHLSSVAWGASTAAAAISGVAAYKLGATKGDIAMLGTTSLWGTVTGLLLAQTLTDSNSKDHERLNSVAMLAGSLAGSATGLALVANYDISRARSWVVDIGAIVGLAMATGINEVADIRTSPSRSATLLAGEVLGLAAASVLSQSMDTPLPQLPLGMHVGPAPFSMQTQQTGNHKVVPGLAVTGRF